MGESSKFQNFRNLNLLTYSLPININKQSIIIVFREIENESEMFFGFDLILYAPVNPFFSYVWTGTKQG